MTVAVLVALIGGGVLAYNALTELPLKHAGLIRQHADDPGVAHVLEGGYEVDIELPPIGPDLIAAVIYAESRFRDQTSSAGARGLMQITPETADTIESLSGGNTFEYEDLADPELNIRYGTFYLRYLLDRYAGNEVAMLAAYNAGEGNVEEWGGAALGVEGIRFEETREYVSGVLEKRREYAREYGRRLGLRGR